MLGMSSEEREFRKKLQSAGADMDIVKNWFRKLEKTKKSSVHVVGRYQGALDAARRVQEILFQLEELIRLRDFTSENKKELSSWLKELKKLGGTFDHPFVVAADDSEYHLIYEAVLKQGNSYTGADAQKLLLQSEVENLLDLTKEILERGHPDLFALCYFYLDRKDKELAELPPKERVVKVERVYQKEFLEEMENQAAGCFNGNTDEAKAAVNKFCRLDVTY